MPAFAAWKKRLVEVVGSDEAGDNRRCALWDFSGYHAHARESVPELGDKSSIVASYWEAGHFKHELGDRMLAQIFDHPDDGFGVCLTAANVDQQIAALSRGEERYVKERPAETAQITYLIRNQIAARETRR